MCAHFTTNYVPRSISAVETTASYPSFPRHLSSGVAWGARVQVVLVLLQWTCPAACQRAYRLPFWGEAAREESEAYRDDGRARLSARHHCLVLSARLKASARARRAASGRRPPESPLQ